MIKAQGTKNSQTKNKQFAELLNQNRKAVKAERLVLMKNLKCNDIQNIITRSVQNNMDEMSLEYNGISSGYEYRYKHYIMQYFEIWAERQKVNEFNKEAERLLTW